MTYNFSLNINNILQPLTKQVSLTILPYAMPFSSFMSDDIIDLAQDCYGRFKRELPVFLKAYTVSKHDTDSVLHLSEKFLYVLHEIDFHLILEIPSTWHNVPHLCFDGSMPIYSLTPWG